MPQEIVDRIQWLQRHGAQMSENVKALATAHSDLGNVLTACGFEW